MWLFQRICDCSSAIVTVPALLLLQSVYVCIMFHCNCGCFIVVTVTALTNANVPAQLIVTVHSSGVAVAERVCVHVPLQLWMFHCRDCYRVNEYKCSNTIVTVTALLLLQNVYVCMFHL